MFKDFKEIENFLEYAEGESRYEYENLRNAFIYHTLGYRKYADTEFLNYFPNELLSKMIYGVIITSNLDLDHFLYEIEESRKKDYKKVREEERLKEIEYQKELKKLNKKYGK